ncbi:MAG: 8-amino-7-oxononanoate synthase [Rikenellaceae bacterium]
MNNINSSQRYLVNVENRQRYLFLDNKQYLNLSSNDYLGLSDVVLQQEFLETCEPFTYFALSNPSSRLMTGNSNCYAVLEQSIARLFGREAALVLSSGYLVNSTLIGALASNRDLIIADKLVHASMIDGIKLSGCDFERFRHNDMNHLRKILQLRRAKHENVYILAESIYSMDGDVAPLSELVAIKNEFDCKIYLDEAHAFGVRGQRGGGLAQQMCLDDEIDIIVATLGKAAASQGGFVVCSNAIKQTLVNKMRGLIFSTAISDVSLRWSNFIIERMASLNDRREALASLSRKCAEKLSVECESHIFAYVLGSNEKAVEVQLKLRECGYWVNAIRYPTVPKGSERLRISLNAQMCDREIEGFIECLKSL